MAIVEDKTIDLPDEKVPGKISTICLDQEDSEKIYLVITKQDGEPGLLVYRYNRFYEVRGVEKLKYKANMVVSFSEADNTQFVYKTLDTMYLYEQLPFKEDSEYAEVKEIHRV
jgi:mRNA degradation ribonuclease J1/J2